MAGVNELERCFNGKLFQNYVSIICKYTLLHGLLPHRCALNLPPRTTLSSELEVFVFCTKLKIQQSYCALSTAYRFCTKKSSFFCVSRFPALPKSAHLNLYAHSVTSLAI